MKGLLFGAGAATAAGLAGATAYFFNYTIVRKKNQGTGPDMDTGTAWEPFLGLIGERKKWLDEQNIRRVSILSGDGLNLSALYFPAQESPGKKLVICFHGYMSQGINDYACLAPFYHSLGYSMLIVDNRAHGESEGRYIGFGILDRCDCAKWIEWSLEQFGADIEIVLHGISMGGATVLMASGLSLPDNVKGIISDCGFVSPWEVFKHILRRDYHLPAFPLLYMTSAVCKKKAGYTFDECSAMEAVRKTKIPIFFIHGEKDDFVPTSMGRALYAACASKKKLLIVPNAGHAASYYFDMQGCEEALLDFLADIETPLQQNEKKAASI